jgi:hypothetical protein
MADNVTITQGSGTTINTDDVGGVHTQRVKLTWGVDGTVTDASATNPLPTTLTNLEKAEDAAHSSGDKGIMALGVVTTSGAATSSTDGDYVPPTMNASGGLRSTLVADTYAGTSVVKNIDVDESEDNIKTSAGVIYEILVQNLHATTDRFYKLYNNVAASITVGTDAPLLTVRVKAGESERISTPHGIYSANGFCQAATTGVADNDTGAPGANEVISTVIYK